MTSIRRSRPAAGLLAVAFLVAASGCGADPPDGTASLPPADATDVADEPSPPTSVATTDAPAPEPAVESAAVTVSAPFDDIPEDAMVGPVQWLVPWDDGFLAAGVRYPPQPLPDRLPPEIAALFPPEVTALFPDGLPPTQQEAIEILSEAGLYDVVEDIVMANSEVMAALQSEPRPDSELAASWSTDGDSWIPLELALPAGIGDVMQVSVSGDRLDVVGVAVPGEGGGPTTVTVTSTADLENWNTATVNFPQPEARQMWATPITVATDDEHWVARVMVDVPNDPMSDLPTSGPHMELWSGAWDGEPARVDAGEESWILLTTSDGFLDLGRGARFSTDGSTWTDVAGWQPDVEFQAAAQLGDSVLAITRTPSGDPKIVVLDTTGRTMTEGELPELDDDLSLWTAMPSPAIIVATHLSTPEDPATPWVPPDLVLLATADGETWLVEDLGEDDGGAWALQPLAAANGTTVLVGEPSWEPGTGVWQRFTIPA